MAPKGSKGLLGPKGQLVKLDCQDFLVYQESRVLKECWEGREDVEIQGFQDFQELQVHWVFLDPRDRLVAQEKWEQQDQGEYLVSREFVVRLADKVN